MPLDFCGECYPAQQHHNIVISHQINILLWCTYEAEDSFKCYIKQHFLCTVMAAWKISAKKAGEMLRAGCTDATRSKCEIFESPPPGITEERRHLSIFLEHIPFLFLRPSIIITPRLLWWNAFFLDRDTTLFAHRSTFETSTDSVRLESWHSVFSLAFIIYSNGSWLAW